MITVDEARRYYQDSESGHDFDHVLRVLALAERIALSEGGDLEIVRAAALLHDLGRTEERQTGEDHAAISARRAREILSDHPPNKVSAVADAISSHRFRRGAPPSTLEAKAVFDADKLDAIGAIGVARVFAHAGAHGSRLWAPREAAHQQVSSPSEHTPVHEFVFKLAKLRDTLTTDTGRAIAAERHSYMTEFFSRLEEEVEGRL